MLVARANVKTWAGIIIEPPPAPNRHPFPFEGVCVVGGMKIRIENLPGSERRGVDADGRPWVTKMHAIYGEIAGTIGADNDPIDVFVGPSPHSEWAYVVHQKVPGTQRFDEDKVILGVETSSDARALYQRHYSRPGFWGGCTRWPVAELRAHLLTKAAKRTRLDSPKRVRVLVEVG